MATADLEAGTTTLPRSESPMAISRLTGFERFHRVDADSDMAAPGMDYLLLEAQKTCRMVDDVARVLQMPSAVGMLVMFIKGTAVKPDICVMGGAAGMMMVVEVLTKKAPPMASEAAGLLEDAAETGRALDGYASPKDAIGAARKPEMYLAGFGLMRYFCASLSVIVSAGYDGISRSLDGVSVYGYDLQPEERALSLLLLVVIPGAGDPERVLGVFRGFGAAAFAMFKGGAAAPAALRCDGGACAGRMNPACILTAVGICRGQLRRQPLHPDITIHDPRELTP